MNVWMCWPVRCQELQYEWRPTGSDRVVSSSPCVSRCILFRPCNYICYCVQHHDRAKKDVKRWWWWWRWRHKTEKIVITQLCDETFSQLFTLHLISGFQSTMVFPWLEYWVLWCEQTGEHLPPAPPEYNDWGNKEALANRHLKTGLLSVISPSALPNTYISQIVLRVNIPVHCSCKAIFHQCKELWGLCWMRPMCLLPGLSLPVFSHTHTSNSMCSECVPSRFLLKA